ncbi:MAG: DUF5716 family protein [bacterium]
MVDNYAKKDDNALLLGIDLSYDFTKITYWDKKNNKPIMLKTTNENNSYMIPTVMLYEPLSEEWLIGEDAVLNRQSTNDNWVTDFIDKEDSEIAICDKKYTYTQLLSIFIDKCFEYLNKINPKFYIKSIMITLNNPTKESFDNVYKAFDLLGYDYKKIQIQGHLESFVYYVLNNDITRRKIGLFDLNVNSCKYFQAVFRSNKEPYEIGIETLDYSDELSGKQIENQVKEYVFESYMNHSQKDYLSDEDEIELEKFFYQNINYIKTKFAENKAANVSFDFVNPPIKAILNPMGLYKYLSDQDYKFNNIINNTFKDTIIPSVYLTGNGFSLPWATKSLQTLLTGRKVTQSQKLFAKGACYTLAAQNKLIKAPKCIIRGPGILEKDIGLKLEIKGKEQFRPIITSGTPWYNAFKKVKIIIDDIDKIPVFLKENRGEIVKVGDIELSDFPERPPKTTKLEVVFRLYEPDKFTVIVEDLGFGKLFEKTNKKWEEEFPINIE